MSQLFLIQLLWLERRNSPLVLFFLVLRSVAPHIKLCEGFGF
jgi:hypothetical protein